MANSGDSSVPECPLILYSQGRLAPPAVLQRRLQSKIHPCPSGVRVVMAKADLPDGKSPFKQSASAWQVTLGT
jgi:hypothetical protein